MFHVQDISQLVFGRLGLDAIPRDPIVLATLVMVALGGVSLFSAMTYFRAWGPLWRNWITSIDHKKIGIMYIILGIVMLVRGFADALLMRAHQAMAFGDNSGFLPPHHYDQIFTAHGVLMTSVGMPRSAARMLSILPVSVLPDPFSPASSTPVL